MATTTTDTPISTCVDATLEEEVPFDQAQDGKPRHVVIAIDVSGSMSGIRLTKAKEGVLKLVESLEDNESFTLVQFDTKVKELLPRSLKKDVPQAGIEEIVGCIQIGGMTSFYDAIQLCMRRLKSDHDERRQLVMLTDGDDTSSESTHVIAKTAILTPEYADFMFVVMGINLDPRAHGKVAGLCEAVHCKMVSITTRSGQGRAVDTAFAMTMSRIADSSNASYNPDSGPVMRMEGRHSPVWSRCASMTEDDEDALDRVSFVMGNGDSHYGSDSDSDSDIDGGYSPPTSPGPRMWRRRSSSLSRRSLSASPMLRQLSVESLSLGPPDAAADAVLDALDGLVVPRDRTPPPPYEP